MFHIIHYEKLQRKWLLCAGITQSRQHAFIHAADNLCQMQVKTTPQLNKPIHINLIVMTVFHPLVLVISDKRLILKLHPYKTLLVVARAIEQVTENLLLAPFTWCWLVLKVTCRNLAQQYWNVMTKISQAVDRGLNHLTNKIDFIQKASGTPYYIHIFFIFESCLSG